ncbi:MAG: class I SAM-dependent methyltransferase [Fibrobacter sp.]|nr:class I SAM-dependent methyltransferase [Fibrobacter sp.]
MDDSVKVQFNRVAREYDENRRKFISCFDDYYIGTTDFIAKSVFGTANGGAGPCLIYDLGSGTGLLAGFWYEHFPKANYVLVDVAEEMLAVAKKRFDGLSNVEYRTCDYSEALPEGVPDVVMSALSIHHLEHEQKKSLFKKIYAVLPSGGLFVNYDQFCLDDATLDSAVNDYWLKEILASGLSDLELNRWQERKKLDRECSIAAETAWLKGAGFESVECVYAKGKFGVICAKKG